MEKKKILIIDDERVNLDFFELMLTRLGFETYLAADGEEGLRIVKEEFPDLIILDNIVPQLTGWELTKLLKQNEAYVKYRDIPIIMFSVMDAVQDKIEGFELGIDDYITKPFNFSEVLARIRAVLRNHELSRHVSLREERLAHTESLNKSLLHFTEHLWKPMLRLKELAETLKVSNTKEIEAFQAEVVKEMKNTLVALEELKNKRGDLQSAEGNFQNIEISLRELDSRFQEHFRELRKGEEE